MTFDPNRYKIYTWKNGMMLHWILNPGLAVNELLFGQRTPKISLLDKTLEKPRFERTFFPCPHCETLHDSRTWSTQTGTAFQNWFGLYCPACGGIIPCLWNLTSLVLLAVTAPLWYWFRDSLREKWLRRQPQRFAGLDPEAVKHEYGDKEWIKTGLVWGGFMFVAVTFFFPMIGGMPIIWSRVQTALPIWLLGGLLFGYTMKWFLNQKGKSAEG